MEEQNSHPQIPQQPVMSRVPAPRSYLLIMVLIGLVMLGLGLGGGYFLFASKPQEMPEQNIQQVAQASPTQAQEAVNPTESVNETANWKTYSDKTYSFKYPLTWVVEEGTKVTEDYFKGDVVTITNQTGTIAIQITPEQTPYGFAEVKQTRQDLEVQVEGKKYTVSEITTNGSKAFVDMELQKGKEYHILFGTGYPAAEDAKISLSDYNSSKDIILQILSTLTITNE